MEQRIKAGELVPPLRLPTASGEMVDRQRFRQHANLALLFLPDLSAETCAYVRELDAAATRWERDKRGLLIAPAEAATLAALTAEIKLPLLADADGAARANFLPEDALGGWFVTDRYGELYAQGVANSAAELPPPDDLTNWLEFISCECS